MMRTPSLIGAVTLVSLATLGCAQAARPPPAPPPAAGETAGIARPADAAEVLRVWPGASPAGAPEQLSQFGANHLVRNVTVPSLTVFRPAAPNGTAIVIAPGGAMRFLTIDGEGYDVARWLASRGVTAIVLKYRTLPTTSADMVFMGQIVVLMSSLRNDPTKVVPLMEAEGPPAIADAKQAVRVVRAHAAAWGLDPHRIGLIGFSAGGTVAAGAALTGDADTRPDFVGLFYPAAEPVVPKDAPPGYLAVAADDGLTRDSTLALHRAWLASGRPVELHVYEKGGHGFAPTAHSKTSDHWRDEFAWWLEARDLLKK